MCLLWSNCLRHTVSRISTCASVERNIFICATWSVSLRSLSFEIQMIIFLFPVPLQSCYQGCINGVFLAMTSVSLQTDVASCFEWCPFSAWPHVCVLLLPVHQANCLPGIFSLVTWLCVSYPMLMPLNNIVSGTSVRWSYWVHTLLCVTSLILFSHMDLCFFLPI